MNSGETGSQFEALVDDYSQRRVPEREGRGYFQLSIIFLGISIAIPSFLLGSALMAGMGLRRAFVAIVAGTLIATPMTLLAGHVGAKSRISTAMTLQFAFGRKGAKMISALIAVDMFCWFAVNTEIFGSSVRSSLFSIAALELSEAPLILLAGLGLTAITIFGYRSVEKLSFLSVPLLVVVISAYFISTLGKASFSQLWESPPLSEPLSDATGISIVAGTFLSVCVLLPDFTRYSRSAAHSWTAILIGLTVGLPASVLLGAYLTAVTGATDFVDVMLAHGWGLSAIIVIALTCWVHMNDCLYSGSLNLAAIVNRYPKWKLTVFAGLAGTGVALLGIVNRYVDFLIVLSVVLPPIAGVFSADYLMRRSCYRRGRIGTVPIRMTAVSAWLLGVLTGFVTSPRTAMGLGLFNLTLLPAIDSFAAAFLFFLFLGRGFAPGPDSADLGEAANASGRPDHD